uniref:HDC08591 n=1 Tax=Drosophila melanogaster TaxID=7227 RepID=Q6ILR6_DROME|nr:TPA_inf: HDC08591 [Drosophila melanogaster]
MAIILPATDIIIQMARTKNHQLTNPDTLHLRHRNSADFVAIGLDAFNLEKMDSFWFCPTMFDLEVFAPPSEEVAPSTN